MGKGAAGFPGAHVWPLPLTGSGSSHLLRECVSSGHQVPFPGVLGPLSQHRGRGIPFLCTFWSFCFQTLASPRAPQWVTLPLLGHWTRAALSEPV